MLVGTCTRPGTEAAAIGTLTGNFGIHDPSLIQVGSCYYAFGTEDPSDNGAPKLGIRSVIYPNGWPVLGN
ncbi:MAG TPA: hypothetical protein VKV73_00800 [Chloroflexota bacterium]|nr:hypothetical protein [Chloroflexota bacterium]